MDIVKLRKIFHSHPSIKLVYLFGSRAIGREGLLSDYDFAFYVYNYSLNERFDLKLKLFHDLNKILQVDDIDVLILNDIDSPELKYNIIQEGVLIYDKEPFKLILEPKILNEYFDFRQTLLKYHLTQA